ADATAEVECLHDAVEQRGSGPYLIPRWTPREAAMTVTKRTGRNFRPVGADDHRRAAIVHRILVFDEREVLVVGREAQIREERSAVDSCVDWKLQLTDAFTGYHSDDRQRGTIVHVVRGGYVLDLRLRRVPSHRAPRKCARRDEPDPLGARGRTDCYRQLPRARHGKQQRVFELP